VSIVFLHQTWVHLKWKWSAWLGPVDRSVTKRSARNFRKREARRAVTKQCTITAAVFAAAAIVLVQLAPSHDERPLVTVYMKHDCASCVRWLRHLDSRGFRTQLGAAEEWTKVRANARVPPRLSADHLAVVQGLYVEGYVPAGDIHRALNSPKRNSIHALALAGAPPGAPGIEAAIRPPFVVFAVDARGLARPWATHNHFVH
jgi:hypothetical protein